MAYCERFQSPPLARLSATHFERSKLYEEMIKLSNFITWFVAAQFDKADWNFQTYCDVVYYSTHNHIVETARVSPKYLSTLTVLLHHCQFTLEWFQYNVIMNFRYGNEISVSDLIECASTWSCESSLFDCSARHTQKASSNYVKM